ncbi:hypothetical protein K4K59_007796 [Colletotrichum sp. SAR11_240]|nr:hypothetical protein K4K59_007796 [Colletotrichum sp. SAR11_240]
MSTTPENEATRAEERSRCWTTNVEENAADESEHQHSGGGFLSGLSGITVTTEISIQPVYDRNNKNPAKSPGKSTEDIEDGDENDASWRSKPSKRRRDGDY